MSSTVVNNQQVVHVALVLLMPMPEDTVYPQLENIAVKQLIIIIFVRKSRRRHIEALRLLRISNYGERNSRRVPTCTP